MKKIPPLADTSTLDWATDVDGVVRDVRDLPSGRKTKGWLYRYLIPSGTPVDHIVCNFKQCKDE